jgi:nitrogen regulatory protein P-II 2
MKLVCAVVRPLKLDQSLESLERIGFQSFTVSEIKGCGQKGRHSHLSRH